MPNKIIDNITVLAQDTDHADTMKKFAETLELNVKGASVWDGPCPEGSFVRVTPFLRMSTAEFYTLRKVSELSMHDAVLFIDEMCGLYETSLTNPDLADGEIKILDEPRTTGFDLFLYLSQVADTDQGAWALFALSFSEDGLGGPIAAKRDIQRKFETLKTME